MKKNEHYQEFITFAVPLIEQAEIDEVVQCLRSGWIGTGPRVAEFESEFAAYKGARNVAAVNSCTAALHLSLLAAGLKPGDEVITSALTFCATVNAAPFEPNSRHAFHLFTVLVNEECCGISRDEFLEAMTQHKIGVGVHYLSVPEHPVYRERFGWKPEDFPNAMTIGRQTISLPLSAKLTDADAKRVVERVRNIFKAG